MDKIVKKETRKVTYFKASDGRLFKTESECEKYENGKCFEKVNKEFNELFNSLGCTRADCYYECLDLFPDIRSNPISLIYTKEREGDILRLYKILMQYYYNDAGKLCNLKLQHQCDNVDEIDEKIFDEEDCEEGKPLLIIQCRRDGDDYEYSYDYTLIITPRYVMNKSVETFHSLFHLDLSKELISKP